MTRGWYLVLVAALLAGLQLSRAERPPEPNSRCWLTARGGAHKCQGYLEKGFSSCKMCCASYRCNYGWYQPTDRCLCMDLFRITQEQMQEVSRREQL